MCAPFCTRLLKVLLFFRRCRYDYNEVYSRIITANLALTFVFQFTTFSAMLICFFSLISSVYTSVTEQLKEIAVLLSLGFSRRALLRAYVEEAFVLVLTSSFLGLLVGLALAWTISLQRNLLLSLPMQFPVPWLSAALMVAFSVLFAVLSALAPLRVISSTGIVTMMKTNLS